MTAPRTYTSDVVDSVQWRVGEVHVPGRSPLRRPVYELWGRYVKSDGAWTVLDGRWWPTEAKGTVRWCMRVAELKRIQGWWR